MAYSYNTSNPEPQYSMLISLPCQHVGVAMTSLQSHLGDNYACFHVYTHISLIQGKP